MAVRVCFSLLVAIVWISLSLPTIASGQDVIDDSVTITPINKTCVPDQDIDFTCKYTGLRLSGVDGTQVQWFLNSSNVTPGNASSGVVVMGDTLTLSCAVHLNNTKIRCAVSGQQSPPATVTVNRESLSKATKGVIIGACFISVMVLVIVGIVSTLVLTKKCKPDKDVDLDFEERTIERIVQESQERIRARETVEKYLNKLKRDSTAYISTLLGDLGSRLQKYWFEVKVEQSEAKQEEPQKLMLTIAPVSKRCALPLNNLKIKATLDKLCSTIANKKHPYVHSVSKIDYIPQTGHVVVIQEKHLCGSLRDEQHKLIPSPGSSWMDYKPSEMTAVSSPDAGIEDPVAYYGWQILQGLKFFYDQGFPPLGHAHTGNIYIHVEKEGRKVCKVGGYDNTLLGYSSKLMKQLSIGKQKDGTATGKQKDGTATGKQKGESATGEGSAIGEQTEGTAVVKPEERSATGKQEKGAATKEQVKKPVDLKWIDVIQFGHVLYEMAEGKCFSIPLPSKDEYRGSSVEEVLDYIFEMVEKNKDISHKEALKKIMKHKYFKSCSRKEKLPSLSWSVLHGDRDVRGLLKRVREGVPVQQKIVSDDHNSSGCETPSSDDTLTTPVPSPDITTAQPVSIY